MFSYFTGLFSKKNVRSSSLFSFTPYKILSEPGDKYLITNNLDHNTVTFELMNSVSPSLATYYENIKNDIDEEFPNVKFEAICFHNQVNIIATISTVPKELLNNNSVICIKV